MGAGSNNDHELEDNVAQMEEWKKEDDKLDKSKDSKPKVTASERQISDGDFEEYHPCGGLSDESTG